ncbi:variable surface protein [Plasmodium gonderi]|uniref:Variable surface protein n=1 Tax=Plasmodium gonderi TaxID=77519 RepID=A0A1Y1JS16_PLAGO|nr:variable surface protein [Plasmodium gonderi]GAW84255.1 variable surface protein [Plasmodium gonderi]
MDDNTSTLLSTFLNIKSKHTHKSGLHQLYKKFDEVKAQNDTYNNICIEEKDAFKKTIMFNKSIVDVCKHLGSIMSVLYKICDGHYGINSNNCYDYLIYWLYGKLEEKEYNVFNVQWIYNKFKQFITYENSSNGKKYKLDEKLLTVLDIKLLKNMKTLRDFVEYYDDIKDALNDNSSNINQYCTYVKHIFEIYKNMMEYNNLSLNKPFKDELNYFHEKINNDNINIIKNICTNNVETSNWNVDNVQFYTLKEESIPEIGKEKKEIGDKNYSVNVGLNYNLFYDLVDYQNVEKIVEENKDRYIVFTKECNGSNKITITDDNKNLIEICKTFIKYFLHLYHDSIRKSSNEYKHFGYLNYWLNKKLRNVGKSVKDFIEFLDKQVTLTYSESINYLNFKKEAYHMNDDVYTKMNILYNLHDKYNKIINNEIKPNECLEYAKNSLEEFNKGVNKFYQTKCLKLYDALKDFRAKYNNALNKKSNCKDPGLHLIPQIKTLEEKEKEESINKALETCKNLQIQTIDVVPKRNNRFEDILESFPSHKIYQKLNRKKIDVNICTKYCENVINSNYNDSNINILCALIASNLKGLSSMNDLEGNYDKRCAYFTYWTYYIIMNKYNSPSNYFNENSVINNLNSVIVNSNNDLSRNDKHCLFYLDGNINEWIEEKDLHDYFENFNSFSAINTESHNILEYCKYLEYISSLYKTYLIRCCTCFNYPTFNCLNNCPKYFKCDKNYHPHKLLSYLKCEHITSAENAEQMFKYVTIDSNVLNETQELSSRIVQEIPQNITIDYVEKIQYIPLHIHKTLPYDTFYFLVLMSSSFLGLFFVFFILYKFTPLGSRLHKRAIKKKIVVQNIQGKPNKKLDYNYSHNKVLDKSNKRIRIAYNSS